MVIPKQIQKDLLTSLIPVEKNKKTKDTNYRLSENQAGRARLSTSTGQIPGVLNFMKHNQ